MSFAVLVLVAACTNQGSQDTSTEGTTAGSEGTSAGGNGTTASSEAPTQGERLVVATNSLSSENWLLHRAGGGEQAVTFAVFETLVEADPATRAYTPGLAESWEASDDNMTWTFHLRPDIPFHPGPDGQDYGTLTAEDVKFSYEILLRDDSVHSRSDLYRALVGDDMDNFEIVDDLTFRIHLAEPYAPLPVVFTDALGTLYVTSKAYMDEVGDEGASRFPVGTGSWRFVDHQPGTSVTLEAVQDHWRQTPGFQTLEIRIIPEAAATLAQVRGGEVDFASIPLALVPEAEAAGLRILAVPNVGISSLYLGGFYPGSEFYDTDSPWIQADNPEQGRAIREAMSLAIDRRSIVDNLLQGYGEPVIAPIHFAPGIPATDPNWEVPEQDLDRARELLAEGGYPDGFEVDMISWPQPGLPFSQDIATAVADMLGQIGLQINFRPVDEVVFDEMRENRASDGTIWQYIQSRSDEPADRFSAFHPRDSGAEFFWEPLDDYVVRMQQESDFDTRMAIARELGDALIEFVGPAIGIAAVDAQYVVSDRVGDWTNINGKTELHHFEYITPAEGS